MPDKGLLVSNATLYVLDEINNINAFKKISILEDLSFNFNLNRAEIKTTAGTTLTTVADPRAVLNGILYNPGDLEALEILFRGAVIRQVYNGSTAQAGEEVTIKFSAAGDAIALPGFQGNGSAVTVNSVRLKSNLATTYSAVTDYQVVLDPATKMTLIKHRTTGVMALETEFVVNYDYTPLAAEVLRKGSGILKPRTFIIHEQPIATDATKYRRIIIPNAIATTDMSLAFLEVNSDNAQPNVMNVTFEQQKLVATDKYPDVVIYDTYNV